MAFMFCLGSCVSCQAPISFNPHKVPSIYVNGTKEPICRACFARWNEIHRTSKGRWPIQIDPEAYEPVDESQP